MTDYEVNKLCGWIYMPREIERVIESLLMPTFAEAAPHLRDTGIDQDIFFWGAEEAVLGKVLRSFDQGIGDCFVAGTLVAGEEIKPIEQVRVGDRVWTAEGKWTRVISTRSIETLKPLVKVCPVGGLPITCTADHKFLVYRMDRVGGKRVTKAYYERATAPCDRLKGPGFSTGRVVDCYEGRKPEWVAASDLTDTDCLLTPTTLETMECPSVPFGLWSNREDRFLLGYFLGDGYAGGGSVEFAVSDSSVADRLMRQLRERGFSPRLEVYRPDTSARRVRVHSKELVNWLRQEFYDADGVKRFPSWAIGDQDFLDGLWEADGHTSRKAMSIDSTSPSISQGAMASLIALGHDPTISEVVRSGGEYANAKPLFRVTWHPEKFKKIVWRDESFVCRPVRKVEFVEGPATVYDIGVEDSHHSFLANGVAVHNCVSMGWARGCQDLMLIQIADGDREEIPADVLAGLDDGVNGFVATEPIYGGSRCEIGGWWGRTSDGSIGAWGAKWVNTYGVITRKKHEVSGDVIDLSQYSAQRAKSYGAKGCPDQLEPSAKEHPVGTVTQVRSYEEVRDMLANHYPVPVASDAGFEMKRGKDGICRRKGTWMHQMLYRGHLVLKGNRPMVATQNSWGNYLGNTNNKVTLESGLEVILPEGCFLIDPDDVTYMARQGDTLSASQYQGYPRRDERRPWIYAAQPATRTRRAA